MSVSNYCASREEIRNKRVYFGSRSHDTPPNTLSWEGGLAPALSWAIILFLMDTTGAASSGGKPAFPTERVRHS